MGARNRKGQKVAAGGGAERVQAERGEGVVSAAASYIITRFVFGLLFWSWGFVTP
jgi:hypothetical protein